MARLVALFGANYPNARQISRLEFIVEVERDLPEDVDIAEGLAVLRRAAWERAGEIAGRVEEAVPEIEEASY